MWFTDEIANPFLKIIDVARPSEENKLSFFHDMLEDSACFDETFLPQYREIEEAAKAKDGTENNDSADRDENEQPRGKKKNPVEKKFLAYTNDFSIHVDDTEHILPPIP